MPEYTQQEREAAAFVLALQSLKGVGPVTVHRLLAHVPTPQRLASFPREQLLHRLRGLPRHRELIALLYSPEQLEQHLSRAGERLDTYLRRGIRILVPTSERYPQELLRLPPEVRPLTLFAYGHLAPLERPFLAFYGRAHLDAEPFEQSQLWMAEALRGGLTLAGGARHGFDVVVHRRAGVHPSLLVADAGFAHIPRPLRPWVSRQVHQGGLLLSPFEVEVPYREYQISSQLLILGMLSRGLVWAAPPESSSERHAFDLLKTLNRPQLILASATPHDEEAFRETVISG